MARGRELFRPRRTGILRGWGVRVFRFSGVQVFRIGIVLVLVLDHSGIPSSRRSSSSSSIPNT
jgi:hypothetical protein